MNRRLRNIGFYRNNAIHKIIDEMSTTVTAGIRVPVHESIGANIQFKYSNGEGFNKVELQLFQNWIVSTGNAVIETNSNRLFQKGELIVIDGQDNIITRVLTKRVVSKSIRNKKTKSKRIVLFIE